MVKIALFRWSHRSHFGSSVRLSSFKTPIILFGHLVLFCNVLQCLVGDGFDEDLSRAMRQQISRGPRPPSVQSNVNVDGQQRSGGRQPNPRNRCCWQSSGTRQRVQPTKARNVRESRTQLPTKPTSKRSRSSARRAPSARFDCSVEASSKPRNRASDWSSFGFLSGFRRACQEAPHSGRGGSYQGTPQEKYTRIRARARVGEVGAISRRGSVTRKEVGLQ